ncbi:hypothetical protein LDENG_00259790 [Lucifuga dentata]|nr:hypothetical protein LDENG_00259790 [Lucifuga dentata]
MFILKQGEPYNISGHLVRRSKKLIHLSSFPKPEQKARLKYYTKFLFVQDPFVRLISTYRSKFLKNDKYFYRNFGRNILRRYGSQPDPPQSAEKAFALDLRPSFYNFIQYLLDPDTEREAPFEPHWRQMYHLCQPCLIQYDFVGRQETLQDDAEQLLHNLQLENDIKFSPAKENMTTPDSVLDWYRTVPLEARRKLYKLYEADFRLFGYRKPNALLDE